MKRDYPSLQLKEKESTRERESNMELLRIIAMVLVLIVHASFKALDVPSQTDIETQPFSSILRIFSESMAIVCVNVFILISGWFGIRPSLIRFFEFIFQILFIRLFLYFFLCSFGLTEKWNIIDWIKLITFHKGLWFVNAYIILYLFSPILNAFINSATKHQFEIVLLLLFSVQSIFGFIDSHEWYFNGSSPLSFFGLYLFARFAKLYPTKFTTRSKYFDISIYIITVILNTFLAFISVKLTNKGAISLLSYSSPIVILSSFYFFLFFTKVSLKSTLINWIAISAFSIYIIHCDPLIFYPYYLEAIQNWYANDTTTVLIIHVSVLICSIFIVSILIDKIRIFVWRKIIYIQKKCIFSSTS